MMDSAYMRGAVVPFLFCLAFLPPELWDVDVQFHALFTLLLIIKRPSGDWRGDGRKMKKYLLFSVVMMAMCLGFTACSDDDDFPDTTYTIINEGYSIKAIIFECDSQGDKIYNQSYNFSKNEKKTFTATPTSTKVKIYVSDLDKWIQQVFVLKRGGNIIINIDGNTIVGLKEP